MNEDVREDHTFRNVLLVAAGAAGMISGAKAGVKLLEKDVIKGSKVAKKAATKKVVKEKERVMTNKDVNKNINNKVNSVDPNVIKTEPNISSTNQSPNVTATSQEQNVAVTNQVPNVTATKPKVTVAEKIKNGEKLIAELKVKFEAEKDPALKDKLKKQIEAISAQVASYKLGNKR